jgi:hypothetical protein
MLWQPIYQIEELSIHKKTHHPNMMGFFGLFQQFISSDIPSSRYLQLPCVP